MRVDHILCLTKVLVNHLEINSMGHSKVSHTKDGRDFRQKGGTWSKNCQYVPKDGAIQPINACNVVGNVKAKVIIEIGGRAK
jgi:hypothetical protein